MVAPTTRIGAKKQDVGSNVNTWGIVVNEQGFDLFDEAFGVAVILSISGDFSLTNTLYASNQARRLVLQLNGSPAAAFVATVPTFDKPWFTHNRTGQDATVKMSTGTGAVVRAGRSAWVYSDGTNCWVNDPTLDQIKTAAANIDVSGYKVTGLGTAAAATDAVPFGQMQTAIAAAGWSSAGLIPAGTFSGQVPRWTGAAFQPGAVDLSNVYAVTGILPAINLPADPKYIFCLANTPR